MSCVMCKFLSFNKHQLLEQGVIPMCFIPCFKRNVLK